jgi:hypothetical protein
LGSLINELIRPACYRSPEPKALLGLGPDREVRACPSLAHARYAWKRSPAHRLEEVRYLA